MFLVGLGLFTLASLAGGLAQDDWRLLAARAVQGLGAAVLAPSTLTILTSAVPEGAARPGHRHLDRGRRGGGAAGGLVGGVLTEGLNWRCGCSSSACRSAPSSSRGAARWIKSPARAASAPARPAGRAARHRGHGDLAYAMRADGMGRGLEAPRRPWCRSARPSR
ncbi:hypothetical protein [Streptomyces sp. KL116D]|uniref:hypothetical protein n=1 Tax=Streptomyces sp. KL116D TaxID=3045152 RepID=UPI003556EF50